MLPFLLIIALLGGQTPPPQNAPRPPQRITPSGQTPEVILLKGPLRVFLDCQYECDTDFIRKELYVGFGVTYRFGSIYNNVVNPRFRNF
jgi:hypothetical protein